MPSTATITSFYTFSAGSKARATQVNNNFDVFRGHIIPIDPNTVASTNVSYDLGSDPNRWRTAYVQSIDFDRSTSTASATIEADANTNTGEIVFKLNGTEIYRLVGQISTQYSAGTTAAQIIGNTNSGGLSSPVVLGSTLTITTFGRHVEIKIVPHTISAGASTPFLLNDAQTTTATYARTTLYTYRNTTTSLVGIYQFGGPVAATSTGDNFFLSLPVTIAIDTSAPTGTHNYFVTADGSEHWLANNNQTFSYISNYKFSAIEIDNT